MTLVSICFPWQPPLMLPHETERGDTTETSLRYIWHSQNAASFLGVLPTPASPFPLQHSSGAWSSKTHVVPKSCWSCAWLDTEVEIALLSPTRNLTLRVVVELDKESQV